MLPIFRMIPVGGVFIAMIALVQALTLPGPTRTRLIRVEAPASGPLIEREQHPEWRQFLILAAIHRAQEILALRSLPDTPALTAATVERAAAPANAAPEPKVASAPAVPAVPAVSPPAPMQQTGKKSPAQTPEQELASVTSPPGHELASVTSPAAAAAGSSTAAASDSAGGATAASAAADAEKAVAAISSEDTATPAPAATASAQSTDMMPSSPAPSDATASIANAGAPTSEVAPASHVAVSASAGSGTAATEPAVPESLASIAPPAIVPEIAGSTAADGPSQPSGVVQPPVTGAAGEPAVTAAAKPVVVAELPKDQAEAAPAADDGNVTGSVVKSAATTVPVGIGEASSLELPVVLPRPRPNLIKMPRARPAVIPPLRHAAGHHVKPKASPANSRPPPDLFSALFDKNYRRSAPESRQQPQSAQPPQRSAEHTGQSP
ncbi:MAG TPA: hypothetical protein VFL51_05045 [Pseudolabrys sp.]|nr:hypothetical protein [Pseudolabrys sp.]